jgi:Cu+-exporting ATPase
VVGTAGGEAVALGNKSLLDQLGAEPGPLDERAEAMRNEAQTVVYVVKAGRVVGLLGIQDPVKPGAPEVISQLKAKGLHVVMLTGDSRKTAEAVARVLGIDQVEAEVLPDGKGSAIQALQAKGLVVAMVGDGINDAPALARADVGVAMGSGTDVAIASAGITLLGGDLKALVRARNLSHATMSNIRQNLFLAFVYNALGVPVAAGVLYPFFHVLLNPGIAAGAMSLSSVSVIGNALRLRRVRL